MATALSRIFCIFILSILITGCSANHHSIYRHKTIDGDAPTITSIDAKQRVILSSQKIEEIKDPNPERKGAPARTGFSVTTRRFCAEPSPDVFSVVAQALSAGGTFSQSADPKLIEAALSAAFSTSEQGSTIPRTQTINMLRELMYRTCERYLNEGINGLELSIQAIRDQRLMVSILAIEQLTGAVTPKPVVIGALAEAGAGGSGGQAAVALDEAWKAFRSADAAQKSRQTEYDALESATPSCSSIKTKADANEALTGDEPTKQGQCVAAEAALANAKTERQATSAHYDALKAASSAGGIPVLSKASLMNPEGDGGLDRADVGDVGEVADTVRAIVQMNYEQDELLFFCLKFFGGTNVERAAFAAETEGVKETCNAYIKAGIDKAASKSELIAMENRIAAEAIEARLKKTAIETDLFEQFWAWISGGGNSVAPAAHIALKALLEKITMPSASRKTAASCFQSAAGKPAYKACFDAIDSAHAKRALAQGEK